MLYMVKMNVLHIHHIVYNSGKSSSLVYECIIVDLDQFEKVIVDTIEKKCNATSTTITTTASL
jgi:hypothetical protein